MKNLKYAFIALIASTTFVGCATKVKLMNASMVSMTHYNSKDKELQSAGPVSGQFCPDIMADEGKKGLIDLSVAAAQEQSGVDFLENVSVWRLGNGCISIEGTGMKIQN
jgi:hypothetical protein